MEPPAKGRSYGCGGQDRTRVNGQGLEIHSMSSRRSRLYPRYMADMGLEAYVCVRGTCQRI